MFQSGLVGKDETSGLNLDMRHQTDGICHVTRKTSIEVFALRVNIICTNKINYY